MAPTDTIVPSKLKLFVFDTETTGISTRWGRIIEFAIKESALTVDDLHEASSLQFLAHPEGLIKNLHIHGISDSDVCDVQFPLSLKFLANSNASSFHFPSRPCYACS